MIRNLHLRKRKLFILLWLLLTLNFMEWGHAETKKKISEPTPEVELTFTGTGSKKTQPFTVQDGWKIEWVTESPTFKLSAHGSALRPYVSPTNKREEVLRQFEAIQPIVLANTSDSKGRAVHPLGGTFYFTVIAKGPWRIDLKTFKDTKDYLDVPYTGAP